VIEFLLAFNIPDGMPIYEEQMMSKMLWKFGLWPLLILVTACTPKYQQAMTLSVSDYQQSVSREETDKVIIFSSKDALHSNLGTTDSEINDNYVKAVIDKISGKVSYQIVNTIQYQAPDWHFYELAKYVTQEGVTEQPISTIDNQVLECSVFSDCSYLEIISFEIDEQLVKKGAERYQSDTQSGIKYLLIPKTGQNYNGIVFAQELVAVYNMVEATKK
jgi:hypothetical protein